MNSKDKRNAVRYSLPLKVEITTAENESFMLHTANISDTGAFLQIDEDCQDIPVFREGDKFEIRVINQMEGEPAAKIQATVMHASDSGYGIKFELE